ncbi:MAG: hypothetical protein ACWGQW_19255, partial [bacterium]
MSFRSMHLLRRSTDLGGAEGTESEGAFQSNLRGKIVIVESRPKEMSQLAAILESLNFHILNVTKDSDLLRLIQDQSPLMILSSRRLPPLEEFRLLGELPETTTFVYVPKSDRPVVPDEASSLRNQVYREEGVVDVEDAAVVGEIELSGEEVGGGRDELVTAGGGHEDEPAQRARGEAGGA